MIKVVHSTNELIHILKNQTDIGYVPTMGNLHAGHLSLIERSLSNHQINVVSIYVNPTQFGAGEDFEAYPRTLEQDVKRIEELALKDKELLVFAPHSDQEIYPNGKTLISAENFKGSQVFEGALRPGHFDGMVTVVKRLFEIIHPAKAYFGEKDYQQLLLVKQLVKEFNIPTEVVGLETARSKNGLALSSRNGYLSPKQIEQALVLPKTLQRLRALYLSNNSTLDVQKTINEIKAQDRNFNYLALANADDLSVANEQTANLILLGNYEVSGVKLLDNLKVK